MLTPKSPDPRGTPEARIALYLEAMLGLLENKFFDVVFGNPDPQAYRIGWCTEDIPNLDLYVGRSLAKEKTNGWGNKRRDVEIHAQLKTSDPLKLSWLRSIGQSWLFKGFEVESVEEGGKKFHSVFFKIETAQNANEIRKTLVRFAAALENEGFRNNAPITFDWMNAVDLWQLDFAEADASYQVARMEEEEASSGPNIDLTQAKQLIAKILNGSTPNSKK